MESIGGGYARGYQLGQADRAFNENQKRYEESKTQNAYAMMQPFSMPGGRRYSGGRMPSASQIRASAVDDALKRQADEIRLQREQLLNEQVQMKNERMQYEMGQQRLQDSAAKVREAEGRVTEARAATKQREAEEKNRMVGQAVESVYSGQPQGFLNYFEVHGTPGVNVQGMTKNPDGSIDVEFDKGTQRFNSANEVINKLIMPAAAIMSGYTGQRMTAKKAGKAINYKEKILQAWQKGEGDGAPTPEYEAEMMEYFKRKPGATAQQAMDYQGRQKVTGKVPKQEYATVKDEQGRKIRKTRYGDKWVDMIQDKNGRWVKKESYEKAAPDEKAIATREPEKAKRRGPVKYRTSQGIMTEGQIYAQLRKMGWSDEKANRYLNNPENQKNIIN